MIHAHAETSEQSEEATEERGKSAERLQSPGPEALPADKVKPKGRLSGVRAANMFFQVQTEYVTYPENQVATIVMLDGRVVMKRTEPALASNTEQEDLSRKIDELHASVEKEINDRIHELIRKKGVQGEKIKEKVGRLFEEGLDKCKERNYEAALALWQKAYALNPANRVLAANIRILLNKINLTQDFCRLSPRLGEHFSG